MLRADKKIDFDLVLFTLLYILLRVLSFAIQKNIQAKQDYFFKLGASSRQF